MPFVLQLLGGYSAVFLPLAGYMADRWVYNVTGRTFRRLAGGQGPNWSSACRPGGRVRQTVWWAQGDTAWMFGGFGVGQHRPDEPSESHLGYLNDLYSFRLADAVDCALGPQLELRQTASPSTSTPAVVDSSGGGSIAPVVAGAVVVAVLVAAAGVLALILGRRYWMRRRAASSAATAGASNVPGSPLSPSSPRSPTALNPGLVELQEMRAASREEEDAKETRASVARMLDFDK